jgi:radical SAM enzyme (TIGR01210 family)
MVAGAAYPLREYASLLQRLMKALTQRMLDEAPRPSTRFPTTFSLPIQYGGRPSELAFIVLRSRGCTWKLKSGGCTMCGYTLDSALGAPVSEGELLQQLEAGLEYAKSKRAPVVAVTPSGSFFDENELPWSVAVAAARKLRELDHVRALYVESRPEHVLEAAESGRLDELLEELGRVELDVGIGLECYSDFVRNYAIHKGFTLRAVERALKTLKERGIYATLYVLLKPAFLSEREAIEEAVRSVEWASQHADRVVLFPLRIYPYTLNWLLARRGLYRPPWLWSLLEVVRRLSPTALEKLIVGGWEIPPPAQLHAHNCPLCTGRVQKLLEAWSATRDDSYLKDAWALSCQCIDAWKSELAEGAPSFRQRIPELVGVLKKLLSEVGERGAERVGGEPGQG